jgi:serine/threonine-protein kinase
MDHSTRPAASSPGSGPASDPALSVINYTGRDLGDFRLLRCLGQGGMGQVYLAEQLSLKRKVAVKLLRQELAANTTALQRFQAEALAVARVNHANIVQVYAVGEEAGLHFMALEYVEGKNLREYLEKKGPPDVLISISIIRQVAAALQRASELGIVHRDIKPENILITRKGEVKVADFGLSRIFAEDSQPLNLTQSGVTMGTPLYMSPEQVEGKPVDPRTDIYSLGVTAYHLLAGQPPFRGQTPFDVALQHVRGTPVPLQEVRPDLPPELCVIVHRMMAKRREDRYQTAHEIVRDLGRLRDVLVGVSGTFGMPELGPLPATSPISGEQTVTQPYAAAPRRSSWLPLVVATFIFMLSAGIGLGWFLNRSEEPALASQITLPPASKPPAAVPDPLDHEEDILLGAYKRLANSDQEKGRAFAAAVDLGLFYLDHFQLEKADKFFKELEVMERPPYGKFLGKLGKAMVLSLKDQPKESNQAFHAALLPQGRKVGKKATGLAKQPVQGNPRLREMIARCLQRNLENDPSQFPKDLEALRWPPRIVPQDKRKSN